MKSRSRNFQEGPLGEMQRKLIPWLEKTEYSLLPFAEWLMGYNLPPVGDEVPPYIWLMDAVEQHPRLVKELAKRSVEAASRNIWVEGGLSDLFLGKHLDKNAKQRRRDMVQNNLFYLLAELLKNLTADKK